MQPEDMTKEELAGRVRGLEAEVRNANAALDRERRELGKMVRQFDFVQRQRDAQVQRTAAAESRAAAWQEHAGHLGAQLQRERSGLPAALKVAGGATAVVGGLHLLGSLLDD